MNQIKWAFSFLGKSKYKLFVAWGLTVVYNLLGVIDPTIVSKIVDDILYPMFGDASITTQTVIDQLLPLALLAFGLTVLRAISRFTSNIFREQASQRGYL